FPILEGLGDLRYDYLIRDGKISITQRQPHSLY
ncbi:unnamed protein product, partial [marine sediment metagenome]